MNYALDGRGIHGSFVLSEPEKEVERRIADAVAVSVERMPFFLRPIARRRLLSRNTVRHRIEIDVDVPSGKVDVAYDADRYTCGLDKPSNLRSRSEQLEFSTALSGSTLTCRFRASDGEKVFQHRFDDDGMGMLTEVVVVSPRLPQGLRYFLRHRREQ